MSIEKVPAGILAPDLKARTSRLLEALAGQSGEPELMLVTDLANIRYLTGFTGSNAVLLIGPELRLFVTDSRYTEQAAAEVEPSYERLTATTNGVGEALERLGSGASRIGFEDTISVAEHKRLVDLAGEQVELVAVSGIVESLRRVKDAGEVALIARAAQIADDALSALLEAGLEGRTERALALQLEHDMRVRGAECPSFDSIIASGTHGALPHAVPRDVVVERGQLVTFDWGAQYQGYCSDCTRTVAVGEPSAHAREVYEIVLRSQLAGVGAVMPGIGGREVDGVSRSVIEDAGYGENFGHGTGHGVGLEIHEAPNLSRRSTDTLAVGEVVTIEPGIYVPGDCGVRIEDQIVIGQDQNLIVTSLPKELLIVE